MGISRDAKVTIDVVMSAKELWERDRRDGKVTDDQLKFTVFARKQKAIEHQAMGLSTRKSAKLLGVSHTQVQNDLATKLPSSGNKVATKTTRELLSQSDQNDWRTPRKFLDAARSVMGAIDLDPASSAAANETVEAKKFFTEKQNGLEQSWKGRVWLNPPYGGEARLFVERLVKEYEVGNVTAACALLNSHPTETKWFQRLFEYAICFVAGRIDFGGPSREISSTSTHGSAIAYLGKDIAGFAKTFGQFGSVVVRLK